MLFGKDFKVLKKLPKELTWKHVGDKYPEYFFAYEKNGELQYYILDDNFGQPSPANFSETEYAIKLRKRSDEILKELINKGYIEIIG